MFAALPNERYVLVEGMDTGSLRAFAKKRKLDRNTHGCVKKTSPKII